MSNNPSEYDVVLGGQNAAPVNAVVLGGIEGVFRRLSSDVIEHRISALNSALNYGEDGLRLLLEALNDNYEEVHSAAYHLLKNRKELDVKVALDKYIRQCYYVRFDGLYHTEAEYINRDQAYSSYFLRFYPDGKVLTVNISSSETDVAQQVAKWFNRYNKNDQSQGIYTIEANNLKFSSTCSYATVDYCGKIEMYGRIISLNTYSHKTYYKDLRKFNFVHIPNIQ